MVSFEPFQVDFGWPIVHYTNLRSRVLSKESVLIVPHGITVLENPSKSSHFLLCERSELLLYSNN